MHFLWPNLYLFRLPVMFWTWSQSELYIENQGQRSKYIKNVQKFCHDLAWTRLRTHSRHHFKIGHFWHHSHNISNSKIKDNIQENRDWISPSPTCRSRWGLCTWWFIPFFKCTNRLLDPIKIGLDTKPT